jgi:1,4-alpha-glucan branching enzyme
MLPLSHDEVVYGKRSLLNRMPGDEWQRFANLRLLFAYMYTHPGSKLLFQGGEFGQGKEWNFEQSLDWHLLNYDYHKGIQSLVADINQLYRKEPALHQKQFDAEGFEWIDYRDAQNSMLVYIRKGNNSKDDVIVICNMTPVPREAYRIGVPEKGIYRLIFNSDDSRYCGSGFAVKKRYTSEEIKWQSRDQSITISLPPLGMIALKRVNSKEKS